MTKEDTNDLKYVLSLGKKPVGVLPAPNFNFCATTFLLDDGKMSTVFHSKPIYYETRDGHIRPLSEIVVDEDHGVIQFNGGWMNASYRFISYMIERQSRLGGKVSLPSVPSFLTSDVNQLVHGHVGLTVTTVYPSAGGVDPCDGFAARTAVDETFATLRAGNGTTSQTTDSSGGDYGISLKASATSNQYQAMRREIFIFDTSSISSGDTVSSAVFSWKAYGGSGTGLGNPDFVIFWGASASNSTIASGDYQSNVASGNIGTSTYASWSANANTTPASATYNNITLSDVTNINKGASARTKIAAGVQWDVNNTTTGLTWSSAAESGIYIYTADTTGTDSDPKLEVTHAVGASFQPRPPAAYGGFMMY